jgi:hypothetical protein
VNKKTLAQPLNSASAITATTGKVKENIKKDYEYDEKLDAKMDILLLLT